MAFHIWHYRPHSLRPRFPLQPDTESPIERVSPRSQSVQIVRRVISSRGPCRVPGKRFCSEKLGPSTSFLCPPERTAWNSTCYPGKGMPDYRRNNPSETPETVVTVVTACLGRWSVGNWAVHVGGSLKTDGGSFGGHTRPHQHGFVGFL